MASFPGATKSDKFRGDPNDLHILGVDGDDEGHPFFSEKQLERALAAEKDEAWLANLASGVDTSVKVYRLAKHRGKADAPTFVLVGQRRVMGLRAVNARRKTRGLQALEIPFEMFTLPQGMDGDEADRKAYACYIRENEGRDADSMEMRALKVAKFIAPTEDGGFGGPKGADKKAEDERIRLRKKECAAMMLVTEMQITHLQDFLKAEPEVREAARTKDDGSKDLPDSAVVALAKLPPAEQLKELPKMVEQFKAGSITVKDAQRQVRNKAKPAEEQEAKVPSRRVWAKFVDLVNDETIAIGKPAEGKKSPEVKGIDQAVYQMAKYLATGDIKAVPYLKAALAKAGFEA